MKDKVKREVSGEVERVQEEVEGGGKVIQVSSFQLIPGGGVEWSTNGRQGK